MNRYRDERNRQGQQRPRPGEEPYDRGWSYGDQGYSEGDEFDWDMIGQHDRGRDRATSALSRNRDRDRDRGHVSRQTFEYGWGGDGYSAGANPGDHAGRDPRGYQRPDTRIADDVCDRLTRHGWIDATDIEVSVERGEVTLDGTVDSRQTKRLAEDVADAVSGVRDVHNHLQVARLSETNDIRK